MPAATGAMARDPRVQKNRLIVFADDWGRHPSSCQHLVRHLLSESSVSWINTIGTRSPRLSVATLRRGMEKIVQWGGGIDAGAVAGPAPQVYTPMMYPGFRLRWQRTLNAGLLARFMQRRLPGLSESVVLSTLPIVADLPRKVHARRWVYYCVDDFSAWPGLDAQPLREMEEKFVLGADRIIAAGENLASRMSRLGRDAHVLSHGIDLALWDRAPAPSTLLAGLPRPIVLFWGLIDRRLAVDYLIALDRSMSAGTIVLVGPQQDPHPALDHGIRLNRLGPCPYASLPALAAAAAVLIMPYADLPVTRAMQPLKLKEYLATGKPVVSSRLPALRGWEDCLDIADSAEQFAALVAARCNGATPAVQTSARQRLQSESWQSKAADLANVVFGE
jgi:glycosyltransferase involved in cell wall biosynthesis